MTVLRKGDAQAALVAIHAFAKDELLFPENQRERWEALNETLSS